MEKDAFVEHSYHVYYATHLFGMQVCLGGQAGAGSRTDRGAAAASSQHCTHRLQPLHDDDDEKNQLNCVQEK